MSNRLSNVFSKPYPASNLDVFVEGRADVVERGLQEMSLSYIPTNLT